MQELKEFVALKLLQLKAFKLQVNNPFTWNTGWISPIYFDSRKLLSYPQTRNIMKLELARLVVEKYPDAEVIAAVAPNAIALGVLVAEELNLPFAYVFPRPKDHGFENRIEGDLKPRQKVVIVEDQLSLGSNSLKVKEALVQDGCRVLGMVSLFDYNFRDGVKAFEKAELGYFALTSFESVLDKALEMERITRDDAEIIRAWHKSPAKWGK